jgi:nucleoid DNA-binding protein
MTKQDIIDQLSRREDISKGDATKYVNCVFAVVTKALSEGENLYLRGLGSLMVRTVKERKGRVISSGEEVIIPEHQTIRFRPSGDILKSLNNDNLIL